MTRITELAGLFFKMGWIAFGGPAAHIAMFEEEVVTKRQWMSRQHFLDLVGATNLIPGPNSTEMAIHCGYDRAGIPGMLASGVSFIFPAALLTGLLGFVYVEYGELPQVEPFLFGIKPAVLAIIINALYKLGQKALKSWQLGVIGAAVTIAALFGVNEVAAILGGGAIGIIWLRLSDPDRFKGAKSTFPLLLGAGGTGVGLMGGTAISTGSIFVVFLKIGAVLFGSGYVLIAYLEGELIEKLGWLTQPQLLDAIAIGQFTPGPVLTTATFIGYMLGGWMGAVAATLGIFLPSFLYVAILNPLVPKMRKNPWTGTFLDAVNVSAVGIMLAVTFMLAKGFVIDWRAILIAVLAIGVVFGLNKASPLHIVIGGAVLGYLLQMI